VVLFNTGPHYGGAMGEYWSVPQYHAGLEASEYRSLLGRSGFALLDRIVEDPHGGGRTVWLARSRTG
jgi:hypothetical protein